MTKYNPFPYFLFINWDAKILAVMVFQYDVMEELGVVRCLRLSKAHVLSKGIEIVYRLHEIRRFPLSITMQGFKRLLV